MLCTFLQAGEEAEASFVATQTWGEPELLWETLTLEDFGQPRLEARTHDFVGERLQHDTSVVVEHRLVTLVLVKEDQLVASPLRRYGALVPNASQHLHQHVKGFGLFHTDQSFPEFWG